MKCVNCGKEVTITPSGRVLHIQTGRAECSLLSHPDQIDPKDALSSVTGVTDN